MNNVKKIAVSLLILGVMTGFTQAATHHHGSKPDATLRLSTGGFALGIGVSWWRGNARRDSWRWEKWHHHVKPGRCDSPRFLHTKRRCCQRDRRRR